ncbi:hypothetical protein SCLCIDRAFT_477845 [Scleroderma citrinum Foug A]|uniref:Uncharacterized protein n=1 Tax=Scleroderma citrinum Foug A TaxID=1036808 RepID=A0A0C3DA27_9AGAM|nr:hypothetical protein SCLCIDRAFT_477845 [Scleroderma citrinum Foug A]
MARSTSGTMSSTSSIESHQRPDQGWGIRKYNTPGQLRYTFGTIASSTSIDLIAVEIPLIIITRPPLSPLELHSMICPLSLPPKWIRPPGRLSSLCSASSVVNLSCDEASSIGALHCQINESRWPYFSCAT